MPACDRRRSKAHQDGPAGAAVGRAIDDVIDLGGGAQAPGVVVPAKAITEPEISLRALRSRVEDLCSSMHMIIQLLTDINDSLEVMRDRE